MLTDPETQKLQAALEQLESEQRRRIDERIAKGEAVRVPPVVVGVPGAIDAERARRLAELHAAGETREIVFGHKADDGSVVDVIVTGVPRAARDSEHEIPTSKISHPCVPCVPKSEATIAAAVVGPGCSFRERERAPLCSGAGQAPRSRKE
jgi:hypothetical protein